MLTPSGMAAKLVLTRRFLARKAAEFEVMERTIAMLRNELKRHDDAREPTGSGEAAE